MTSFEKKIASKCTSRKWNLLETDGEVFRNAGSELLQQRWLQWRILLQIAARVFQPEPLNIWKISPPKSNHNLEWNVQ